MKILIVSQYYPPENNVVSPTLAQHLTARGHSVRVLTGFPNYPKGVLYEGYSQHWRDYSVSNGIELLRVPLWTDHSQSAARRALNYCSFALSSATALRFAHGADVVYVYATQMTASLGPWLWRLLGGAPYVLHVQDLWPDSITGSSIVREGKAARAIPMLLNPWLKMVYRHAAGTIGIAPTMVETLISRGTDPASTHLVYNWADENLLALPTVESSSLERRSSPQVRLLFGGNIGDMQDLENVIRAAHNSHDAGIHLTVVGDGVALPRVRTLAESLGSENIEFVGRVPPERMGEYYSRADFALVTLKDLPTFRGTIPSKMQAALARGVPLITTVQGDVRNLVQKTGVGFTAEAEDAGSLELAFRSAARQTTGEKREMARRALITYKETFSLAAGVSTIERILLDVVRT